MNSIVFVFVPVDASKKDFSGRVRECLEAVTDTLEPPVKTTRAEADPAVKSAQLWTWFIPNPRPPKGLPNL